MKAILTYHSIDGSGSVISLAPDVFRRQMEWLARSQVRTLTLGDLGTAPEDEDAVALTFDDGFVNFDRTVAPIISDLGLPATLFVVTNRVGLDNRWNGVSDGRVPALPLLDWTALGRLVEDGVALGSHTRSHPDLRSLSGDRLADELAESSAVIAREVGAEPEAIAYPYGGWDERVTAGAREYYRMGLTTGLRAIDPGDDPICLPRLDMYYFREPDQLEAWGTGWFGRHLWIRRQARSLRARVSGMAVGAR